MIDLPTLIAKMPTADKITADWGDRCPDHDPDCFSCQVWAARDAVSALLSRIEELEAEAETARGFEITWKNHRDELLEKNAAAEAKLAEAVKVKPLEWKGMVPTAETIVGEYSISRIGGNWSVGLLRHGNSYDVQIASGEAPLFEIALIEAKAAAQADYESRIRSALIPEKKEG